MTTYRPGDAAYVLRDVVNRGTCLVPAIVISTDAGLVTFEFRDGYRVQHRGQSLRDFAMLSASAPQKTA